MPNFKLVAPYCGVRKYDKRFFVNYLETEENIRCEYIFNTDTDASNFSHALENLTACLWQDKRTYNCSPKVHNSASSLG